MTVTTVWRSSSMLSDPYIWTKDWTDEPLVKDNDEAVVRLAGIADAILLHERDIERSIDDSVVVDIGANQPLLPRQPDHRRQKRLGDAVGDVDAIRIAPLGDDVAVARDEAAGAAAILLTLTVTAFSSPGVEFGPLVLAEPLWAMLLWHCWQVIGQHRRNAWFALSIHAGLLLLTTHAAPLLLAMLAVFALANIGEGFKRFDRLPQEKREAVIAALDAEAESESPSRRQLASMSRDYLKGRAAGTPDL